MKQSEIEVGKTYHNGEGYRTERKVTFISRVGIISFQTIKGSKTYEESHLGRKESSIKLKTFAKWAQGIVE